MLRHDSIRTYIEDKAGCIHTLWLRAGRRAATGAGGAAIKKNVLNACAQTVAADGVIQEMEAELLRAIADTLDCPIPPFIPALARVNSGERLAIIRALW